MTLRRAALLAALAAALLAPPAAAEEAPPAALPGVDVAGLGDAQRAALAAWSKEAFCYCGCPHTVAQCLREHGICRHAGRMARLAARLLRAGAKEGELAKIVSDYFASFDRRAKLDVEGFGPPLGDAAAPVTMVEYSDFTCPYCQRVRPTLEAFVKARPGRVKLVFKPFPIESHPGALEAALAAEWARADDRFWPMHDALFESPQAARSVDDLADLAREVGGDPDGLREALADKRHAARVRASQAEARAAGIRGTPTLFLNGRRHVLSDFSEEGLEETLADEEEWLKHRGWERD